MKSTDLRIGNTVLNRKSKTVTVDIYNLKLFNDWEISKYSRTPPLKPIALTEDILLRFGFEKDDSGVEMSDPDYCEWYQKEFPVIGELCQSSDKAYLFDTETDTLRIRYVHQLQNLYHSLTGEELILK